jgi:hypothetical protein
MQDFSKESSSIVATWKTKEIGEFILKLIIQKRVVKIWSGLKCVSVFPTGTEIFVLYY